MSKKPLQIVTTILGLVPLITGIVTMLEIKTLSTPRQQFKRSRCLIATSGSSGEALSRRFARRYRGREMMEQG